jgi:hypothetical protein
LKKIKTAIMKKLLIIVALGALAACNSNSKTESMKTGSDSASAASPMADVSYPYDILYSSKFEMADPKYGQSILQLWKDWDNGNLSTHKDFFADTVTLHVWSGDSVYGVRDSVIASAQNERNKVASSVSKVFSIASLKSIDKDQNWALVWGMETDTDKKGKVDSFYLQETWGFNKDGKINVLYQYKQGSPPMKK